MVPGVDVGDGVDVGVTVVVGDGVTVAVDDGVAVGVTVEIDDCVIAVKEVMWAVTLLCMSKRRPERPDERLLSVVVSIQVAGSAFAVGQTLAESVELTTLKRKLYDVPARAAKGIFFSTVVVLLTFFWMNRLTPSMYALYQWLVSVQRSTAPKLVAVELKLLIEPLNKT